MPDHPVRPAASTHPAVAGSVEVGFSHHVGDGGCSAAQRDARGDGSPVLDAAFTKPFRWQVVPEPDPHCATTSALGEAETREIADADLRRALSTFAAGFGYSYEVTGHPAEVREFARLPIGPRDVKPPVW